MLKNILSALIAANLILAAPSHVNQGMENLSTNRQPKTHEYKLVEPKPTLPRGRMQNIDKKEDYVLLKPQDNIKGKGSSIDKHDDYVLVEPQPKEKEGNEVSLQQRRLSNSKEDFVLLQPKVSIDEDTTADGVDNLLDEDTTAGGVDNLLDGGDSSEQNDTPIAKSKSDSRANSYKRPGGYGYKRPNGYGYKRPGSHNKPKCVPGPLVLCPPPKPIKPKCVPRPNVRCMNPDLQEHNDLGADIEDPINSGNKVISGKGQPIDSTYHGGQYVEVTPPKGRSLSTGKPGFKEVLPKNEPKSKPVVHGFVDLTKDLKNKPKINQGRSNIKGSQQYVEVIPKTKLPKDDVNDGDLNADIPDSSNDIIGIFPGEDDTTNVKDPGEDDTTNVKDPDSNDFNLDDVLTNEPSGSNTSGAGAGKVTEANQQNGDSKTRNGYKKGYNSGYARPNYKKRVLRSEEDN